MSLFNQISQTSAQKESYVPVRAGGNKVWGVNTTLQLTGSVWAQRGGKNSASLISTLLSALTNAI